MELNRNNIKKIVGIVAFAIVLYVGLQNIGYVFGFIGMIFSLFSPLFTGFLIAFLLNIPMARIENVLFRKSKENSVTRKLRRPISLILTLLIVAGILVILLFVVIPELGHTLFNLAQGIPSFYNQTLNWVESKLAEYPEIVEQIKNIQIDWQKVWDSILQFLQHGALDFLNSTVNVASSVVNGVVRFTMGVVLAIYMLLAKDKLSSQAKIILYAFLPENRVEKILSVGRLAQKTFGGFLFGQCLEICILGTLFFTVLTVLNFPYALLISVMTAFLYLIPIVGMTIACVIGAFLIFTANPTQALWFLLIFIILQQIEANLIYPHVVGNSVGLPSVWLLCAIIVGSATMGIAGILLFIPLCSVLYSLFRENIRRRLEKKKIEPLLSTTDPSNKKKT